MKYCLEIETRSQFVCTLRKTAHKSAEKQQNSSVFSTLTIVSELQCGLNCVH